MPSFLIPPVNILRADHARLEEHLNRRQSENIPSVQFLLSEMRRARILDDDSADQIGCLDKWVTYCVDSGPLEHRILVLPDASDFSERLLSVFSPIGAALIGLKTGDQMPYLDDEGSFHIVALVTVRSQLKLQVFNRFPESPPHFGEDPFDPGPQAAARNT
jgi:regulator of nucleoside diphosphate kinase